ncbi:A disintegrin and metalloproteinase with thrombospondin motifs 16-like [Lingula anatina]|uniref:A disintegrin and metalloproteinase with thrombospondin motifs 16-like n=1 Tax=Lingula anatina TaxID=7574 RepID=A0A1S3K134_LINAN|nr:A disintegrin and metalloproteinase with thrombospondin motifs 16-like [Lingula anatina]|eukprot:XP_013416242.1 A disintegrin and metalloproteinase with thrombospondin motifs 16-like [Lingula anatina]
MARELGAYTPDARYIFKAHGREFDLRLKRNDRINVNNIPVYESDETGRLFQKPIELGRNDDFTLYQDLIRNAAVAVYTDKRDGKYQKKMEGFVMDHDMMYELRHVEDDKYTVIKQDLADMSAGEDDMEENPTRRHINRLSEKTTLLRTMQDVLGTLSKKKTDKTIELKKKKKRGFSATHINAGVELMICTDDSIWDTFMQRNNQKAAAAEKELKRYYALIVNGGIGGAPWISSSLLGGEKDGRELVDKTKALYGWCEYREKNYDDFSEHDHGMVFTARELASSRGSTGVAGAAYVGGICSKSQACSIVESHGGFGSFIAATHELGHNLGAHHDGASSEMYNNAACAGDAGNVMAAESGSSNPKSGYYFSSCSVQEFKKGLQQACCLANKGQYEDPEQYAAHTKHLPGQLYNADEQCQMLYGSDSRMCRPLGDSEYCKYLLCSTVGNACIHKYKPPADGTECDENKWCIEGACVTKGKTPPSGKGHSGMRGQKSEMPRIFVPKTP